MHSLRPRGAPDTVRALGHDHTSVTVPLVEQRVFQNHEARTSSSSSSSSSSSFLKRCFSFAVHASRHPRRFSLLYWYRLLKKRRLLCCGCVTLFCFLLLTLITTSLVVISLTWHTTWTQVLVREYLAFLDPDEFTVRVPGAVQPREPSLLWGLSIEAPTSLLSPPSPAVGDDDGGAQDTDKTALLRARLEARYGDLLMLYTFANGTEANHAYRRLSLGYCGAHMQSIEVQLALHGAVLDGKGTTETCTTPMQQAKRNGELFAILGGRAKASVSGRDRETDELRHSIRSLEQHVQWHRGRVVIVSPGHHPTWVDGARNFLAGTCGGAAVQALRARGTHLRLTTVHQDALMATHARLTVNTHPIEHQLWRVKNITPVHVYMNDDYFVNRDVAITDLFNEYGGTIVRVESSLVYEAVVVNVTMPSWAEGVSHTNYFTIDQLDLKHEDAVSTDTLRLWQQQSPDLLVLDTEVVRSGAAPLPALAGPDHRFALWVMLELAEAPVPANLSLSVRETAASVLAAYGNASFGTIRPHFFATHAPFVYCTNMLRYLASRYQKEYSTSMFLHRTRSSTDLYVPFLYNAFVMARPWEASPRFPAYLLLKHKLKREAEEKAHQILQGKYSVGEKDATPEQLQQARAEAEEAVRSVVKVAPIRLDNCDGCAPATMLVGRAENGCLFGRFVDDLRENHLYMREIARKEPLFFNVNTGLTTEKAANQLRTFLGEKFSTPLYLEKDVSTPSTTGDNAAMTALFDALMQLPVLAIVSYHEGVCPLVRSLSLAFPNQHHKGPVHVAVQRHGLGEVDPLLSEVRAEQRYALRSTLPSAGCTFTTRVQTRVTRRGESVAELARQTFSNGDGAEAAGRSVELPSTCGAASGTAGLRVRGFVIDARTPDVPIRTIQAIHEALAMPGQTLALEDFRAVHVGPGERDVVLVLARADADAKAVHWITGASENDLLVTFPLPVEAYEDMEAMINWVEWKP